MYQLSGTIVTKPKINAHATEPPFTPFSRTHARLTYGVIKGRARFRRGMGGNAGKSDRDMRIKGSVSDLDAVHIESLAACVKV